MFEPLFARLSDRYHLVAPDYPGFGHLLRGGSIEKLSKLLGHSSIRITERYGHLRLDLFSEDDLSRMDVDLNEGAATVHELNASPA